MDTTLKYDVSRRDTKNEILGGIITGQIAGLIMAVVVMLVFALFLGKSPLFPVQVIGSGLLGPDALVGVNIGAILTGLVLHQLGPSLLWGLVYGLFASQLKITNTKNALLLGLGVGVLSMIGPYIFIPFAMNALHGVDLWNQEVPMFWDWAAHLVFGASFFYYPKVMNRINSQMP